MGFQTVLLERRDQVGLVTLNRPEKLNAIDNRMAVELGEALEELDGDPAVGAIVLTGAGRAFSAGADFSRFEAAIRASEGATVETPRPRRDWIELVRAAKPVICAINGAAVGAGLTRTLPCDVRIASTQARFSMRFVRVGLVPEIGSSQILAQIVGLQHAADLMLSGRYLDAEEALRIGLVLEVVEPERLLPRALELASEYAEAGPETLLATKRLLYANCVESDLRTVTRREAEELARRYGSAEQREAVAAFREKRAPRFRPPPGA
jgi:2-(1,2-epoxy-1,2-dihydrophenyl)acetyl-CoA isomerase